MTAYVENFKKYKPLLSEQAVRDIKTRYPPVHAGGAVVAFESAVPDDCAEHCIFQSVSE